MSRGLLLIAVTLGCLGCAPTGETVKPSAPSTAAPQRLATKHLPNSVRIHPKVISGGLPEGEAGFAELKRLGVQTVISVDGAQPDVEAARKYGLRYVHLPHGYDGIPQQRVEELAKAVRDLPGPIYIHCHHGKHRSPAAAATACVAAGMLSSDLAGDILETAGTSRHYRGLYDSAQSAQPLEARLLDELAAEFPEIAEIPPMAEAMVALETTHDRLKTFAAASWRKLERHPDLDPAHEALLLREHFTELLRTDEAQQQPRDFQQLLTESEQHALQLEQALQAWQASPEANSPRVNAANRELAEVTQRCEACHQKYRDVPRDGR